MIKELAKKILAGRKCNLCHNRIYKFIPISDSYINNLKEKGFPIPVNKFETLNYGEYTCPSCNANDRDRLIGLYLEKDLLENKERSILDIAPSSPVRAFLKQQPGVKYRSADLYMEDVDDKVDIQNMNIYKDNTFDVIICSHVLEHIPDDIQALREMYRILKPGGKCILLVPIPLEDVAYDEELGSLATKERERRFGQDDHVRLYTGKIFEERILAGGFRLEKTGTEGFSAEELKKYGIAPGSILYIGKK